MPGPLITRKDIANGAVSSQPRVFDRIDGKSRAARVFFYFQTADIPEGMPHALGKTPTGFRVVSLSRQGTPGTVYAPTAAASPAAGSQTMQMYNFGRNYVVLACSTGATWAEVEVF